MPQDDKARMRAILESFMQHLVERAVANADQALREAGLTATVLAGRSRDGYELVVKSSLSSEDHRRAEDIADAVLQSILTSLSSNRHLH